MGGGVSKSNSAAEEDLSNESATTPLVALLNSHGRQWPGPNAGIFFERDPAPAVIAHCEEQGIKFEDPDFDPNGTFPDSIADAASPLASRSTSSDTDYKRLWSGDSSLGEWKRFEEMPACLEGGTAPCVIDGLSITDVVQGGFENCWLCAVICAAINFAPEVVSSMMSPREFNKVGCYSVRLWVEGRPLYVPVDDRIFCSADDGGPHDMHSMQRHEMIVPLIAKALAKWLTWYDLNGDERDANRTTGEGCHLYCLRALTGSDDDAGLEENVLEWQNKPPGILGTTSLTTKDASLVPHDEAGDAIRAVLGRGAACTTGGASEDSKSGGARSFFKGSKTGPVDTHAYAIPWHGQVAGVELIQLRNPWGSDGEWNGDWSADSSLWTERPDVSTAIATLAREDGLADNGHRPYCVSPESRNPADDVNDGIFFMAFEDFIRQFSHIEHVDPPFGGVAQEARAAFLAEHKGKPSAKWRIRPNEPNTGRWDVSGLTFFAAGSDDNSEKLVPMAAIASGTAADAKYDGNPGWDDPFATEEDVCCGVRADDRVGAWCLDRCQFRNSRCRRKGHRSPGRFYVSSPRAAHCRH
jgi:hypothetical protein